MTVWCRLSWRARFLNIGLLPISEDRATLGSDSSAVWGFAGGDAFGCRSFLMPGFSHVSVVFQPWEQGWPHYILCLIMGLTSEYVGTLGHDTPAISGQFRSAATVEDVDSKYMSIYKEEKNKKDCFEHLISLQDCDHRFHANAECATCEQDS